MSQWIAAITRGHNGGICLLKDGKIVFAIEEERLSRQKYDGGPFASMVKILNYTSKLDYLVIAHTQPLDETAARVDFTGDDVYTGLARKLGLIDQQTHIIKASDLISEHHHNTAESYQKIYLAMDKGVYALSLLDGDDWLLKTRVFLNKGQTKEILVRR